MMTKEISMRTIYADFNDFAKDGTLPLTCSGSIKSIISLDTPLTDGEEVILTDGDLIVIAQVFRLTNGTWEGRSNWKFTEGSML